MGPRFALFLLAALPLLAQNTATIFGTALDAGGAVMPGVEVTVTHTQTGLTRQVTTGPTGDYVVVQLPIGSSIRGGSPTCH